MKFISLLFAAIKALGLGHYAHIPQAMINRYSMARRSHLRDGQSGAFGGLNRVSVGGPSRKCRRLRRKLGIA